MRETSGLGACPYCGSEVEMLLDAGGAESQSYIEDCEVCCRPIRVEVVWGESGAASLQLMPEDE